MVCRVTEVLSTVALSKAKGVPLGRREGHVRRKPFRLKIPKHTERIYERGGSHVLGFPRAWLPWGGGCRWAANPCIFGARYAASSSKILISLGRSFRMSYLVNETLDLSRKVFSPARSRGCMSYHTAPAHDRTPTDAVTRVRSSCQVLAAHTGPSRPRRMQKNHNFCFAQWYTSQLVLTSNSCRCQIVVFENFEGYVLGTRKRPPDGCLQHRPGIRLVGRGAHATVTSHIYVATRQWVCSANARRERASRNVRRAFAHPTHPKPTPRRRQPARPVSWLSR